MLENSNFHPLTNRKISLDEKELSYNTIKMLENSKCHPLRRQEK